MEAGVGLEGAVAAMVEGDAAAGITSGTVVVVGGAVVVETVFSWPGLGRLTFDAVTTRDYPVLLGLFLVMSILVIAVNLLTDLIHRLVDPRLAAR